MNSVSFYFLLILIFLGLSKGLGLTQENDIYIKTKEDLAKIINKSALTIILIDMDESGVFLKSYYHRYRIVFGQGSYEDHWFKVSSKFFNQNKKYLGLSLFRRYKKGLVEDFSPMMPGALFISDPAYGSWVRGHNGKRVWIFHDLYQRLPRILGIKEIRIGSKLKKDLEKHRLSGISYTQKKGIFTFRIERLDKNKNELSAKDRFIQTYFTSLYRKDHY